MKASSLINGEQRINSLFTICVHSVTRTTFISRLITPAKICTLRHFHMKRILFEAFSHFMHTKTLENPDKNGGTFFKAISKTWSLLKTLRFRNVPFSNVVDR